MFLNLAEVLALDQKPEQAREALARAVALFQAKGNVVAAQRARERLTAPSPTHRLGAFGSG
jgi:hypothetical protein